MSLLRLENVPAPGADSRVRAAILRRRLRLALVAASFSTFVALTSHLTAGGELPTLAGILVPLGLAYVFSLWLTPIRSSWLRLGLSVALSQFAFHAIFTLGAPSAFGGGAHPHHHASNSEMASAIAAHTGSASASVHLGHDTPFMWAMHGVAALVTTLVLFFGEAILRRLSRVRDALGEFFAFVLVLVRALTPRPSAAPATLSLPWVPRLAARAVASAPRRGPPSRDFLAHCTLA
ncbi:hypothetical protein [Gulosibacter sediminis]|uniref:hypothetical protein n=1 Tax=Gulosibacter sediminis TaxID=1729695 RepID=UPI0018667443|nr:hypothetical protein [Gulosibacter sediminis]